MSLFAKKTTCNVVKHIRLSEPLINDLDLANKDKIERFEAPKKPQEKKRKTAFSRTFFRFSTHITFATQLGCNRPKKVREESLHVPETY